MPCCITTGFDYLALAGNPGRHRHLPQGMPMIVVMTSNGIELPMLQQFSPQCDETIPQFTKLWGCQPIRREDAKRLQQHHEVDDEHESGQS